MVNGFGNGRSTRVSRVIKAPRQAVYRAWLDADSLASWLAPTGMKGQVHELDAREGGSYRMSLTYDRPDHSAPGKTSDDTDTFRARFVQLVPGERIVEAVVFDSNESAFAGEMRMTVMLEDAGDGTEVTVLFENIPSGISLEDNETGSRSTLEHLAAFLE